MGVKSFQTDALNGLCSKDQLKLLDSIDSLRSQGISHYVSLPQIIVCGDQSSGKSSVLEAISGVSFPVKSNLCTRFPTELVLRKTSHVGVRVSIVPHQSRSESERLSLSSFQEDLDGFDGLPNLIESAKAAMAISTHGRAFSKDLLRVEVSGPDRPHLTIVDLPGLIHSETKQQSASDVELVQDVVRAYMRGPRSIILAVVSAKNDYANQIVLKLARDADKKGTRTLGVITKPDTLSPGSESEAMYASLAKNQDVEFRLGWHVLKNMDSEKGMWSLADRDVKEEQFFSQGIWKELARSLLGINQLRERLSRVLLWQIAAELPSLISEIDFKSDACRSRLKRLGEPRATLEEQRLHLLRISQSFQSLAKAAVDGTYNDPFFEDPTSEAGYHKRMRAWIQNLNLSFAEDITKRGHRRELIDSPCSSLGSGGQVLTTRTEYLDHIHHLIQRTRGRELPGTFNPMIVADLFLEQSSPWEAITRKHIEEVWRAAKEFLSLALTYVADAATSKALLQNVFEPSLNQLLGVLEDKTKELLRPHQSGHPITYNHYFTENLQKVRNEWSRDEYIRIIQDFFGVSSLDSVNLGGYMDLHPLVTALSQRREPDMNRLACSEALDCMEAYYKVALKRFIDDVAVEIVEVKLVSKLYDIFSPITVISMSTDLVTAVAGESEESRAKREQLTKQLEVLTKGSEICKRFIVLKAIGAEDGTTQTSHRFKTPQYDSYESDERSDGSGQEDTPTPEGLPSERPQLLSTRIIASNLEEAYALSPIEALDAEPAKPEVVVSFSKKKSKRPKVSKRGAMYEDD